MTEKNNPRYPLETMSEEDFQQFREKYLDEGRLSEDAVRDIERLFGTIGELCCNEYHAHHYSCVVWEKPESAIVARLLDEIKYYQNLIREIHSKTE